MGHVTAPPQRQPPATARDRQASEVGKQWPQQAPCPLRGEVERHPEPKQSVGWTDGLQIARSGIEHGGIGAEQCKPRFRERGGEQPDGLAQTGRDGGADPGRPHRAVALAGADVGSDHGDEGAAQPENERDKEIFDPRAGAVTGDGGRPELADETRRDADRQIGCNSDQRGDGTHAQDVPEQRPAKAAPGDREADDTASRPQVGRKSQAPQCVKHNDRHGATGNSKLRERTPAENEARRYRDQRRCPGARHDGRHRHIAGATDHIGQRIEEPDQDCAGEDDVGIGQCRAERGPASAHRAIEPWAAAKHAKHEGEPQRHRDRERVEHQGIGIVAATSAQRTGDRRRDAAAHGPCRHHLHQHHHRKHQRDARKGGGPELTDEISLDQPDRSLCPHHQHVRRGEPQQRRGNRLFEQRACAGRVACQPLPNRPARCGGRGPR
jgi:hypothetical protein